MPVALLLQTVIKNLASGAKKLAPWGKMAVIEELLIDRARGAFLVHWFGASLPLEGLSIRIAIANLDQLSARYDLVLAERNRRLVSAGPNLLEPLAGLSGMIAGFAASPVMLALITARLHSGMEEGWAKGLAGLGWALTLGGNLFAPLLPLFALAGGVAVFVDLAANPERLRQIYAFLGAGADLLHSGTELINQLTGPREQIRNRLLRTLVELADRIPAVTIQIIGAASLLLTRIVPLLAPLPAQLRAFYALSQTVQEILLTLWRDFLNRLLDLFEGQNGPFAVVQRLLNTLSARLPMIGEELTVTMRGIADFFQGGMWRLERAFRGYEDETSQMSIAGWLTIVEQELINAFTLHETVQVITRLIDVLSTAKPMFRDPPGTPSAPSTGLKARIKSAFVDWLTPPPIPNFPALPELPDPGALARELGGEPDLSLGRLGQDAARAFTARLPDYLAGSREMARAMRRARTPRPIFAPERRRLAEELGAGPEEYLRRLYEREVPVRQALLDIAAGLARDAGPGLAALFHTVDSNIYARQANVTHHPPGRLFPVRAVAEADLLRPDLGELRVRAVGVDRAAADDFARRLQDALRGRRFPVLQPAGVPPGLSVPPALPPASSPAAAAAPAG